MMKKFLTVFVVALLSLTCFMFACGQDEEPNDGKTLAFTTESATVRVYEELQLLVDTENIIADVTFQSSDTSKATVDSYGMVKGVAEGTVTITASADGLSDTVQITVAPFDPQKLSVINPYIEATLFEGEKKDLGITMGYDGEPVDIGTFTYTIPTDDSAIATVDANGRVTAGVKGTTTLHYVGKLGTTVIGEGDIKIVVGEKVDLSLNTEGFQIYVYEGSDEQNQKPTTFTIEASALVNDVAVENAEILYSGYDASLITVDATGFVTVNTEYKLGTTVITVSYTTEKGTSAQKQIEVSVAKPAKDIVLEDDEYIKQDSETYDMNFAGEDYQFPVLTSVSVDGKTLALGSEFTYEGYVLGIKKEALANTTDSISKAFNSIHSVQVVAENDKESFVFTTSVTTIDFAIGSASDFTAFMQAIQKVETTNQYGFHAILTQNVDYANAAITSRGATTSFGYFTGILDGRGYALVNVNISGNALFWGFTNAVIKNIAFVNVTRTSSSTGAVMAWNGSTVTFENVYVNAVLKGHNGTNCGLMNNAGSVTAKNFIFDVEFPVADTYYAMSRAGKSWAGKNTYVISKTAIGFDNGLKAGDNSNKIFTSMAGIHNLAEGTIASFTSEEVNGKKIWSVEETGTLVFVEALNYLPTLTENNIDTLKFVEDAKEDTTPFYVVGASSYELSAELDGTTFALKTEVEGASISGNVLDIANTVAAGTEIVVVATTYAPYTGKEIKTELTLVVGDITSISAGGEVQKIVKNKADKSMAVISLGENELVDPETLTAQFKGSVISAENITIEGSELKVNAAGLATSGAGNIEINLKTETVVGEETVVKYYVLSAAIDVVDYEIGTKDEFTAYLTDALAGKLTKDSVAYLTADIDYEGSILPATSSSTLPGIKGLLDGQGHYVTDMVVYRYSMFTSIDDAIVRNIAFVNIEKRTTNDGGLFSSGENSNVLLENLYVQGKITVNGTRAWGLAQNFGGAQTTMRNVIVSVEFTGQGASDKPYNVFGYTGSYATATNVYGVSSNSQGFSNGKTAEVYGSLRGATAAMTEENLKAFTDVKVGETAVWVYDEETKSIYFRGTKELFSDVEGQTLNVDVSEFIPNGDTYVVLQEKAYALTSNMRDTVFALKEEVEGVSIENNTLTIAKSVALGSKIELTATGYGSVANTAYPVEFELYVGEVLETQTYYRNKSEVTAIDLSKFSATQDNTVVKYKGAALTVTITEGILAVTIADLDSSAVVVDGEMTVQGNELEIVVDGKVIISKIIVVDKLIETKADFSAWVAEVKTDNATALNKNYYVELGANLDLTDESFVQTKAQGEGVIQGIFDGKGYTISNLTLTNKLSGLFAKAGYFTVQNVGFVNASAESSSTAAYLFANTVTGKIIIKNSYIQFTSEKKTVSAGIAGSNVDLYNTVFEMNVAGNTASNATNIVKGTPVLENVILVTTINKEPASVASSSSNYGVYASIKDVKADVYSTKINIDCFDTNNWNLDADYPVWIVKKV